MTHGAVIGVRTRAAVLVGLIAVSLTAIALHQAGTLQNLLDTQTVRVLFQSIVWEGIPFILLGAALSAVIDATMSADRLAAILADTWLGRVIAGLLGLALPVCDCGAVPIARTLRRKGVGESVAFTFVLGTPTLNVLALVSTFVAFHQSWRWVFLRGGFALLIALVAGWIVRFREDALTETWLSHTAHDWEKQAKGWNLWRSIGDHAGSEVFAVGPFFVASALLAAIAQGLWPIRAVTAVTEHSLWSIPLLMLLGSMLSLCSEADAFVAASLTTLFSPGAVLAFLLMGQTADLRNLLLMPRVFGKRTVALGLVVVTVLIFLIAVMVNRLFPGGWV